MPRVAVEFRFAQRFPCSADELYAWATDYAPGDIALMGKQGRRRVRPVLRNTLILTDAFVGPDGRPVPKRKLIRLYPERRAWTNTHLSGPNLHSQFLYEAIPDGRARSLLVFTGNQVADVDDDSPRALRGYARELRRELVALWKTLAASYRAELRAAARGAVRRRRDAPGRAR